MKDKFLKLHHEIENDSVRMICLKTALIKYMLDKGYYFDVQNHLAELFETFTFDHILSLWAGRKIFLLDEAHIYLNTNEIIEVMQILFDEEIFLKEENELFISEIYRLIYCADEKTPDLSEFVTDILREAIKLNDKILDPVCGSGILLSGVYDALMYAHYKAGSKESIEQIHEKLLTQNIHGCDASNISCFISVLILALKYKEFVLCENIICRNPFDEKNIPLFDWVISDLSANNISDMRSFSDFQYAKNLLNKDGKLIFMFNKQILHRQGTQERELRKQILNCSILKVVDICENKFLNLKNLPVIFYLEKGSKSEHLFEVMQLTLNEKDELSKQFSEIRSIIALQDELSENEFVFYDQSQSKLLQRITALCPLSLEDIVRFFQGIISGCDKAFVVHDNSLIYSQCIGECGVPWIKGKDITEMINFYGQYLLYTNNDEDIDNFPLTKKRLEMYKSLLLKRRECIKGVRKWYELQWGREKESFYKEKIIFAAKSKKNNFIYDDQGYFFSADIYGAAALDSGALDLKKLALLLNSNIYEWYMKSVMKKISNGRYAYYPDTLKKIRVPSLDIIASFHDETDINDYFGFNVEEIND